MDRFIGPTFTNILSILFYLKSNMDRFIATDFPRHQEVHKFKIQYG